MANTDKPMGFLPYKCPNGNGNPVVNYHRLHTSNSEIKKGDPVTFSGANGVDKASAGNALCGIAAEYKAASSGGTIAVWDDPEQEFVAQTDDGTGTLTAATNMTLNANFVASSNTGDVISNAELDESSGANTATLPFKTFRLAGFIDNAHGEFNRLIVKINNHQLAGGTGTSTGA